MDRVDSGLFVGTLEDANDLKLLRENGLSTIVSLTYEKPASDSDMDIEVEHVPMMDGPQNDTELFQRAVTLTVSRLKKGDRVLVHCSAGASRSPSVAATEMAIYRGISLEEAFEQIRECRSQVDPHEAMVRQAARVFTQLRG